MHPWRGVLLSVCVLAALMSAVPGTTASPNGPKAVPGEILVRFKAGISSEGRAQARRSVGASFKRRMPVPGLELLRVDKGSERGAIAALEGSPAVIYAEPNLLYEPSAMPNDPWFPKQWGLHNTGAPVFTSPAIADADIDAPEAWNIETGSSDVVVAIVDNGIAYNHLDMAPNRWTNPGESGSGKETNGIDDDLNGFVDDYEGWDFGDGDNNIHPVHTHGTHVGGTVAAAGNNNYSVTGVSWNTKLMALKTYFDLGTVLPAMDYARDMGAKVVNGSFSTGGYSQAMSDFLTSAPGVLFVFAAGNTPVDADASGDAFYPCKHTHANVLCVAASNYEDGLWSESTYGATSVDIAAPGHNIQSAYGRPGPRTELFSDDFETDLGSRWILGDDVNDGIATNWGRSTTWDAGGSYSLTDSPGGDYGAFQRNWAILNQTFDLKDMMNCAATYDLKTALGAGDTAFLNYKWSEAVGWTYAGPWHQGTFEGPYNFNLSTANGLRTFQFRFSFDSDNTGHGDGIYVDNFRFACTPYIWDTEGGLSGTSMATPHVAGVAALLLAQDPTRTVAELRSLILDNVDLKPAFDGKVVSDGRLNAYRALAAGAGSTPCADLGTCAVDTDNDGLTDQNESGDARFDPDQDVDEISDGSTDPDGIGPIGAGPDNCVLVPNPGQADAESDGNGDVCDPNDDNDPLADTEDVCPVLAEDVDGVSDADGCPDKSVKSSLSISYSNRRDRVSGKLSVTPAQAGCISNRKVTLYKVRSGPDLALGSDQTDALGRYAISKSFRRRANIYTKVGSKRFSEPAGTDVTCTSATSSRIRVPN